MLVSKSLQLTPILWYLPIDAKNNRVQGKGSVGLMAEQLMVVAVVPIVRALEEVVERRNDDEEP